MSLLVLVPQGAEYQSVKRGFADAPVSIVAIPAGLRPVRQFLTSYDYDWSSVKRILVMGLCGSLTPDLSIGNTVIYSSCQNLAQQVWQCEVDNVENTLAVRAVSSDRVIALATDKRAMRLQSGCDVVDMEGTAVLDFFAQLDIPVTMLRVISDDAAADIPDLSDAIDDNGKIQSLPLALGLMREPVRGLRLIRGSLRALNVLEAVASNLRSTFQLLSDAE